jgi:hypothetical protein
LDGLDNKKWGPFKEKWDTIRAIQLDADPDSAAIVDAVSNYSFVIVGGLLACVGW